MGVSETQDVGISVLHDAQQAFLVTVFEEVLVYFSWASMHEQQVQFVVVQLVLHSDVRGQRPEVLPLRRLYDLVGEGDGKGAVGFFLVHFIGAAAVVAFPADAEVVVPRNGRDVALSDFIYHLVCPDVVAHQIPEAVDEVGLPGLHIGKKRLQSRQVGVDVAEQSNLAHVSCMGGVSIMLK